MKIKLQIRKDKSYRIKAESEYFKNKYGIESPVIHHLERDVEIFGDKWTNRQYIPAVMVFMLRIVSDDILNITEPVYYGKIKTGKGIELGELVLKSELEAMKSQ